jgi:hypothetical protein
MIRLQFCNYQTAIQVDISDKCLLLVSVSASAFKMSQITQKKTAAANRTKMTQNLEGN